MPHGMSLNPSTGVVSATQVNGAGGYAVTVQVSDSGSPAPSIVTATLNFGVNSDSSFGGCQMFPPDSIYNQRIDQLPVDTMPSHQIPSSYLSFPIHPDVGHGFYPYPGGIPFMRVPANQPTTNVNLANSGQLDTAGTRAWPFPAWPNAAIEGTSYGDYGGDHHVLILQSSVNNINGPQTGPCTLYETYQYTAVQSMFNTGSNTWSMSAGVHYPLNGNQLAASTSTLDTGAQDSPGIPIVPLLLRYCEVPLGVQHPLRMTFPSPTDWFVWPGTGCCTGSGPPQGLLYRLKAGVNWEAACPVAQYPEAATILQALQQYGAYMSDHGSAGYIGGAPDVRWDDDDLACIKKFHVSDLEPVDNSVLEVSEIRGETRPYVSPATLPDGNMGTAYSETFAAVGGNPDGRQWSVSSGALPPGLLLDAARGTIAGTLTSPAGSPFRFSIAVTDGFSGHSSDPRPFVIALSGSSLPVPDLTISKTHQGTATPGQIGDTYTITVGNSGSGPSGGTVTVSDIVPAGLSLVSMAGNGWTCGGACTRADALAAAANFPAITVTVSMAANAPASVTNTATVSGGGDVNSTNNSATAASAELRIATASVPATNQYQGYSTGLTAIGGTPPRKWSVVSSTGVSLPEGMSLNSSTGVVSAAQVNGAGGYAVTVQVADSGAPSPSVATVTLNFEVNSDSSFGGCQMFPPDSIYNQRIDQLPVDTVPSHQIPSSYLSFPLHPDVGHGFYPYPGGIPFMRVPANQPTTNIKLTSSGQLEGPGTYSWPFPAWPNAAVEGTSYGVEGGDHHILILQSSVNNIDGPQTGPCTLYETYQFTAVPGMYNTLSNTWFEEAGAHYILNRNDIAASTSSLDSGAQDSPGIPIMPLLLRYSEVPLAVRHPLRMTFPSPTNWFVWPATGCCNGSGPPQGLLYRLKASVNWQAACPVERYPQAATILKALQEYGAYLSDHGGAGYIGGVPDVRWDDNDLACIKTLHVSDLEVVDNSVLEVSEISGETRPYVAPATLPDGTTGADYSATLSAVGGNPATLQWSVASGALPPGMSLDESSGAITGMFTMGGRFSVTATDTGSGHISTPQAFSINAGGALTIASVTNSASGTGGAIAPGELITIKGQGMGPATGLSYAPDPVTGSVSTTLAGVQVSFGGFSAPILFASSMQINAIIPWEVAGHAQVAMQVQYAGGSANWTIPVSRSAPAVFTFDSTGSGQAAAATQDGSVNGNANPAAPGSYVTVYFTGGGTTDPPGVTGSVTGLVLRHLTETNVTVTVGNVPATVTFAGAAPPLVDGVNQLNIQLAAGTPTGNAVPLAIAVGGQTSAATATLSVR